MYRDVLDPHYFQFSYNSIEANDILEVLGQHKFSSQRQIDVLQVIDLALYQKQYPQDIHGIIKRKIQLLQQPPPETTEKDTPDVASIKVRSIVILEMLKQMQLGTAHNDLSKICKLIAFLTGNSYNSIYNELQKGVYFSHYLTKSKLVACSMQ